MADELDPLKGYTILCNWSQEAECYVARVAEDNSIHAHATSMEGAIALLRIAAELEAEHRRIDALEPTEEVPQEGGRPQTFLAVDGAKVAKYTEALSKSLSGSGMTAVNGLAVFMQLTVNLSHALADETGADVGAIFNAALEYAQRDDEPVDLENN